MARYIGCRRTRYWVFTLNNPQDGETLDPSLVDYAVIGEETGDEGTLHFQGFAVFKRTYTLNALKKLLPRAHWEPMKGTPQQAADYCKKDGKINEYGKLPEDKYKKSGDATKKRWRETIEKARAGDIDTTDDELQLKYYHQMKRIRQDHPTKVDDLPVTTGEWYYGPPGTGKSYTARVRYPGLFDKPCNKWWDGYQGEEYVLLDDFDMSHACLGHHLKRWADCFSFPAEQKGSTTRIRPKKIIVTSNYLPGDIWSDDPQMVVAIKRRFRFETFDKVFYEEPMREKVINNP